MSFVKGVNDTALFKNQNICGLDSETLIIG